MSFVSLFPSRRSVRACRNGLGFADGNFERPFRIPGHAHLNLLGWVSLFLFGIYYRLNPLLDRSKAALAQVGIWCSHGGDGDRGRPCAHGHEAGDPIAAFGSLVLFAGMIHFGWFVFRGERAPARDQLSMAPAE